MPSENEIAAAHRAAAQLWPDVSVSLDRYVEMLQSTGVATQNLQQWGGDLYLACAAGAGDHAAVRVIEERFIARLPARIRRLGSATDKVSDILQTVRERLFSGDVPRIRAYNGAGPLEQWIKVVAIRTAIDLHRTDQSIPRIEGAWLETVAPRDADVSALMMKVEYKRELELAIQELVGAAVATRPRHPAPARRRGRQHRKDRRVIRRPPRHRRPLGLDRRRDPARRLARAVPGEVRDRAARVRQHGAHGAESAVDRSGRAAGQLTRQPRDSAKLRRC